METNMKDLLISEFSQDPLFKQIERKGFLEELFDEHILNLNPGSEYSTTNIEEWYCDENLKPSTMRHWQKQLDEYIESTTIGARGNVRLGYRSVFRLRMALLLRSHNFSLMRICQFVGIKPMDPEVVNSKRNSTETSLEDINQKKEMNVFRQLIGQMIATGLVEVENDMPILKINEYVQKLVNEQQNKLPDPTAQREYVDQQIQSVKEDIQHIAMQHDPKKERIRRKNDIFAMHKINRILKEEAIKIWNDKPETERTIKVGLFRRIENAQKKEEFIQDYINKHFEYRLQQEFENE